MRNEEACRGRGAGPGGRRRVRTAAHRRRLRKVSRRGAHFKRSFLCRERNVPFRVRRRRRGLRRGGGAGLRCAADPGFDANPRFGPRPRAAPRPVRNARRQEGEGERGRGRRVPAGEPRNRSGEPRGLLHAVEGSRVAHGGRRQPRPLGLERRLRRLSAVRSLQLAAHRRRGGDGSDRTLWRENRRFIHGMGAVPCLVRFGRHPCGRTVKRQFERRESVERRLRLRDFARPRVRGGRLLASP